jgi:hypothetical protein
VAGISLALGLPMYLFRNRYPLQFPAEYATAGQLARFLAQAAGAGETAIPWTDETIWLALRAVLALE